MNTLSAEQQRALDLLSGLTEGARGGLRETHFLTSAISNPSWHERPEQWAADWCAGWAFHLQPSLAEALDLRLAQRTKTVYAKDAAGNKIPLLQPDGTPVLSPAGKPKYQSQVFISLIWTQGSGFAFREGYTVHDAPEALNLPWSDALRVLNTSIQITQASPAVPAAGDKARDPGHVTFRVYKPNEDRTQMEAVEERSVTQDEFVRILICGIPENTQGEA